MEWEICTEAVLACANEVCGVCKVGGGQVREGIRCWDDKIKLLVK